MSLQEISATAALVDASAAAAANTYYDNAVRYGVAKYPRSGIRTTRNWPRFVQIAKMCIASGTPVESFVTAAFLKTLERHPMVTAADICKYDPRAVVANAEEDRKAGVAAAKIAPIDMWNMLSCKLLDMVFALDGIKDTMTLLDNAMYGFPAWFRVFSPERPPEDIIVHWGDIAFDELSSNPSLEEYLKSKRPDTYKLLKSVADKVHLS